MIVTRRIGGKSESAQTNLTIKKIISSASNEQVGYLHYQFIDAIECYIRGGRVQQFGWPAMKGSVRDRYAEYLLFCETSDNLSVDDIAAFDARGFNVEEIIDLRARFIHDLFKTDKLNSLILYRIYSDRSGTSPANRLALSPKDLAAISAADDIAIPWNSPRFLTINGEKRPVVGFSLPRRCWLKSYLQNPETSCPYFYDEIPVIDPFMSPEISDVLLEFDKGKSLTLHPVHFTVPKTALPGSNATDSEQSPSGPADFSQDHSEPKRLPQNKPAPVLVPVQLLAHIDAYLNGQAEFDQKTEQFIPVSPPPAYTQARLYANTIDDVLAVVKQLELRHYAYRAQTSRIKEIKGQDQQLQDLVLIVGVSVFLFGIMTVFSLFLEATERKRGTIGILRVMGVSRPGVFLIVFIRAFAVGLLAGLLTWGFGRIVTVGLNWRPDESSAEWLKDWQLEVSSILNTQDVLLILFASTICCLIGSIIPAWRASQRDPFDAIADGRM